MPSHPDRVRKNYCPHNYSNEGKCIKCGKKLNVLELVRCDMNRGVDKMRELIVKDIYNA